MDKATLRSHVFEILKTSPQTHFHAIENDVRRLAESYERQDVLLLQEVLWELLVQGVLAPGKNSLNLNLPFVHLTEYGTRCLEDGRILVHDPDGYIAKMQEIAGEKVDDLVIAFVREALAVFLSGSWTSSVILLARASEYLFDRLARAAAAPPACGVRAVEKDVVESLQSAAHRAQRVIESLKHCPLEKEAAASIEPQLHGLLSLIQLCQHPDGSLRWPHVSRDQGLGFFLLYPEQCAFVYHLIATLEGDAAPRP